MASPYESVNGRLVLYLLNGLAILLFSCRLAKIVRRIRGHFRPLGDYVL